MNLLNKTAPWLVASILVATSGFAQQDKSSKKCPPCSTSCDFKEMSAGMPGYNAPSRINVCGNWDFYADASFIYWQVTQDNLSYAFANKNNLASVATEGVQGDYLQTDFNYKPGFKVGAGMNFGWDNWDSFVEYTRLHGTNTTSSSAPANGFLFANTGNLYLLAQSQAFSSASSSFTTNLDFVDWALARSHFVGKELMFRPVMGARGAWITQNRTVHYKNPSTSGLTGTFGNGATLNAEYSSVDVYARTHSWGIGAETGMECCWMLGQGIKLYGNGYADMLYTKYKLQNKTVLTNETSGAVQSVISKNRLSAIRTHLDLEIGFGWSSYFDSNNWHIDLSAGYGFQVFFNQDMFRNSTDSIVATASTTANGDMTIQGLTAKVRIDF